MLNTREVAMIQVGIEVGRTLAILAGFGLALTPIIDENQGCCRIANKITGKESEFDLLGGRGQVRNYLRETVKGFI